MEAQDAVKLCYQAAFGAEHLLRDKEAAYQYLEKEYAELEADAGPLYEQIHPGVCRVSLAAWKREQLPLEWLFRMFAETAANPPENGEQIFRDCLDTVEQLINGQSADSPAGKPDRGQTVGSPAGKPDKGQSADSFAGEPAAEQTTSGTTGEQPVNITAEQWRDFLSKYPLHQPEAVHHSERYRSVEHPAYRLVCSRFIRIFPILQVIAHMPQGERIVALDGRCASGKTTLAEQLAKVTGAGVVHMDDFFLPPELRRPERLAEPGGNVHYERFAEEVLPFLRHPQAFRYRRFDCSRMEPGAEREVREGELRIVEGAYSCHPVFGEYMGLRVFCSVEPQEQLKRIEQRDGAEMLENFRNRWIPMEEQYFRHFQIREQADLVL